MQINEPIVIYTHRQVLSHWKEYLIGHQCDKKQINALVNALNDALLSNYDGLQYLKSVL